MLDLRGSPVRSLSADGEESGQDALDGVVAAAHEIRNRANRHARRRAVGIAVGPQPGEFGAEAIMTKTALVGSNPRTPIAASRRSVWKYWIQRQRS